MAETTMSVSYIVPVWREDTYAGICKPWIDKQVEEYGAELIEVRGSKSIFQALERGRRQALNQYLFYVHDDVRLLSPDNLTPQIIKAFEDFPRTGLIGPVGKINSDIVPWWKNTGRHVGHYCRRDEQDNIIYRCTTRSGAIFSRNFSRVQGEVWDKFAKAGLVDGFFLAEDRGRVNTPWDLSAFGENWHGYDADRCYQTRKLGFEVMVSPWLFLHDNAGHKGYKGTQDKEAHINKFKTAGDKHWLSDLEAANVALRSKWGLA